MYKTLIIQLYQGKYSFPFYGTFKYDLTNVIRAQARKAQGPIDFVRILFFFFFFDYPGIFGGLNMVKNSLKFAHTLEPAAIRTPQRLGPGRGTEALRATWNTIRKLDE